MVKLPYVIHFAGPYNVKPGRGPNGIGNGWTMGEFATAEERDAFMRAYPDAAMPCWRRVVAGVP
jgi:hypothetical protein